jgi:hypothetical protein
VLSWRLTYCEQRDVIAQFANADMQIVSCEIMKRWRLLLLLNSCCFCLMRYVLVGKLVSRSVVWYIRACYINVRNKTTAKLVVVFWRDSACCIDDRLSPVHS